MAGSRQHFIPQMLLRYFADGRERVLVMRRDGRSFVAGTQNIGLESEFFGAPGPGTPDESITREELRIAPMLRMVNAAPEGAVDTTIAAELIAHLTVRVRSFRTFMRQVGDIVFQELGRRFSQPEDVRSMLREHLRSNPNFLAEEIHKHIRDNYGHAALGLFKAHPLYHGIIAYAKDLAFKHLDSLDAGALSGSIQGIITTLLPKLSVMVEDAHKKVALVSPTPEARVDVLVQLSFAVQDSAEDLILGDSVGWGLRPAARAIPLYMLDDDLCAVFLPTSRSRMLMGWRGERPRMSPSDFNLGSVQASEDFIVSHPDSPDLTKFAKSFTEGRNMALSVAANEIRDA